VFVSAEYVWLLRRQTMSKRVLDFRELRRERRVMLEVAWLRFLDDPSGANYEEMQARKQDMRLVGRRRTKRVRHG